MTIVLKNSAKIKPQQHILAVPLVTSPGIIRSEAKWFLINDKHWNLQCVNSQEKSSSSFFNQQSLLISKFEHQQIVWLG